MPNPGSTFWGRPCSDGDKKTDHYNTVCPCVAKVGRGASCPCLKGPRRNGNSTAWSQGTAGGLCAGRWPSGRAWPGHRGAARALGRSPCVCAEQVLLARDTARCNHRLPCVPSFRTIGLVTAFPFMRFHAKLPWELTPTPPRNVCAVSLLHAENAWIPWNEAAMWDS